MLKNSVKLLCNVRHLHLTKVISNSATTEKWDILGAVCLERKPVVTPNLNEIEQKFQNMIAEMECERSFKSNHEIRHEQEVKQQSLWKKGDTDVDVDVSMKETAQDLLDSWSEELSRFKFGDRITEDDKLNNVQSLNRKLDKHLVLLVKQQLGEKSYFLLPQGLRQDGETLRQTAERVLKETCGADMKTQFYGNAPSGFYKFKYPKEVQTNSGIIGAKVFIYSAKYCKGKISTEKGNAPDIKWLDRGELSQELHSSYHRSIAQFLIDEK